MITLEKELELFLTDPSHGDTSNAIRQTARQYVAATVEDRVFLGFYPQAVEGIGLTLRASSHRRWFDVIGESPLYQSYMEIITFGRGPGVGHYVRETGEHVRQSLVDYCGAMGEHYLRGIDVSNDMMMPPYRPDERSDDWIFQYVTDFEISLDQVTPNP